MADQKPLKEPSVEEMMAATKEPTIEEMMAATQGPNVVPAGEFGTTATASPDDFGLGERTIRGARQVVKGASLGASEVPMGYITAASSLIGQGKLDEAKGLMDNLEAWYYADWQRQQEYQKKYPTESLGLEMAGGVIPTAPAAKIAQAGIKEGMSLAKQLGQMAGTGAAATGAYKAAEIAALPQELKPSLAEEGKEIATAAGIGAVAGPTMGLMVEGVARSPELVRRVATSAPVLKFTGSILGPPSKVMKQYVEQAAEISKLPSINDLNVFFGEVRSRLTDIAKQSDVDFAAARANVENLELQLAEQTKTAKGDLKSKLEAAQDQVKLIAEDLKFAQQTEAVPAFERASTEQMGQFKESEKARRQAFEQAQYEYKESLKDPNMGPFAQTVQNAFGVIKQKVVDQSAAARELIKDDVFFDTNELISFWKNELQKLKVKGTQVAKGETAEKAINGVTRQIKRLYEMPPRITGDQLKDLIQGYDEDVANAMLRPGEFGAPYDNAIKAVRKNMDTSLKAENEEYAKAIAPVAELNKFLDEARKEIGIDPGPIESSLRKSIENPRVYDLLSRMEKEAELPVLAPVREAQGKRALKGPPERFQPGQAPDPRTLPEYQQLQNLRAQQELIRAQDFNRGVFEAVKDTPTAQAIIGLRAEMKKYSDPEYVQAEIAKATQEGRMSLEQAQTALDNLTKQREAAGKWMRQLIGEHISKPEDLTMKILRASDNPVEQAQATKIIDAVTQLPTPLFNDLFDSLLIGSPREAQRMFRSMRVDDAMNKARGNGSKGVNLMKAIFVGAGAGATAGGAMSPQMTYILAAFGGMAGALRDDYGGQVAKVFLRNAARMQGIPTAGKLASAAIVRETAPFKNTMAIHLTDMASSIDPKALYTIAEATRPAVERDIKQSKMSAIDRAKALTELNQLGGVSGQYVRKIMLESAPPVTTPAAPQASEALEADKPDMAQRLSKRTGAAEQKGLRGIVSRMREA